MTENEEDEAGAYHKACSTEMSLSLDMIEALHSENGVTAAELSRLTGWTPQAVRRTLQDIDKALMENGENARVVETIQNGETIYQIRNVFNTGSPET